MVRFGRKQERFVEPPRPSVTKSIAEHVLAGCQLAEPLPIFVGIYSLSNGYPCKGCSYLEFEDCAAYHKLYPKGAPPEPATQQGETVREQAARLGVSISEVRRQRRQS
jgi:hypothetical protein